jgi:cytochrome P450
MSIPPGPKPRFPLGNIPEFSRDTLQFLLDIRQYGDLSSFKFGPFTAYVATHPDLVHQVLVTDADKARKPLGIVSALYPVLGNGLFSSDGEFWKRQRKLVQPAFHTKRIGAYGQVMVDYASALGDRWQSGQTYAIDHSMTDLTMQIIARTLFDADVSGETSEVGQTISTVLDFVNHRLDQLFPLPLWIPTAKNRDFKQAVGRLNALIYRFIDERRKSGKDNGDLLSMLLMAQGDDGSQMSDLQVRDEAMTLFGAGHETTAVTLTWTWYLLSQHPEVEAKLHEELARVLGGRTPTIADLPNLPYTEMVIKETMRLFPPAFTASRQMLEPITLGGYAIPKDSVVLINIYGLHRDARYFPEPDRFDPERFSPENEKRLPKYAYLPFGGGPRVCIGNAFASMEARLILATLAQRFHLSLAPGHQVVPERKFTLRPKFGMKMVVTERTPELA